jgi:hypothetical protein
MVRFLQSKVCVTRKRLQPQSAQPRRELCLY